MKAMVLRRPKSPLSLSQLDVPRPGAGQVLIKVRACGVCRTDLHIVEGELTQPALPLVPGHEIVGDVEEVGKGVDNFVVGDRVGIPWLGGTCGTCTFCQSGQENLCDKPRFTGYDLPGGYAEYAVAHADFCFRIPDSYSAAEAAPLLCAGLIGYRSYWMAGECERLGIYGFGAAAHIITQLARAEGRRVFAFTRPGDADGQRFALQMGAEWSGSSTQQPPIQLDAAIIYAPVGALVPVALEAVRKGGRVVCAGIHMSQIPAFDYEILWGERSVHSVANLTRRDGTEFFNKVQQHRPQTTIRQFDLANANEALRQLRDGGLHGAAVLTM